MPGDYSQYNVLIVDDEKPWLRAMGLALERTLGCCSQACADSREALPMLAERDYDLVLLDITMPHLSGQELLVQIREAYPHLPVIMTTGLVQVELAVDCMKRGAFDYFVKTTEIERILNAIRRAFEMVQLRNENQRLRDHFLQDELDSPDAFADLLTDSPKIRAICQYIAAIAKSPEPVLILGESGVGKELAAKAIHAAGHADGPWVAVNVAGLDDNVFSDTLFGHVKGAYTGADRDRAGMIEQAAGGVLFLDEIGDLSPASQVKLLRLLQEGDYYPLGSDTARQHSTRFVFATNRDLDEMQRAGKFRTDLYYRLNAYRVQLPALRDRRDDLPLLLDRLLDEAASSLGKEKPQLSNRLLPLLEAYPFPGNIRELRAMIFEALSLHRSGVLGPESFRQAMGSGYAPPAGSELAGVDLPPDMTRFPEILPTLKQAADQLVDEALRRADGNQTRAAKLLGISRPALSKRLKNRS